MCKQALILLLGILTANFPSQCAASDPIESAIGVTRNGTAIACEVDPADSRSH